MRARDVMSRPVYTVGITETIEYAAALRADRKVTAAPVLDATGRLVGMVSEGDLLRHQVPHDPTAHARHNPEDTGSWPNLVRDVMSTQPVTAWPEADLADVAARMLRHNVRGIPILHEEQLVGIVSRRDILHTLLRTDQVLRDEAQHRLDEYANGVRRWRVIAGTVPGIAAVRDALTVDLLRS
jgi:CBS domain-containing protein